jgi:hypothetical protein
MFRSLETSSGLHWPLAKGKEKNNNISHYLAKMGHSLATCLKCKLIIAKVQRESHLEEGSYFCVHKQLPADYNNLFPNLIVLHACQLVHLYY